MKSYVIAGLNSVEQGKPIPLRVKQRSVIVLLTRPSRVSLPAKAGSPSRINRKLSPCREATSDEHSMENLQVTFGEKPGDRATARGHDPVGDPRWSSDRDRSLTMPTPVAPSWHTAIDPKFGQNLWSVQMAWSSALARESHSRQDASHISEAGDHARHRIVG